ncbi:mandelate racemase/muconate lactonizing enzyme family protein [Sodalis sp. RH20]|uniref:mandelate racemase/muconate lactonizing enzyme family protein n=1 Tax=unclassified Sodalis (in: enterobacteria) TaxID=2636512 RepID=UPI0039B6C270
MHIQDIKTYVVVQKLDTQFGMSQWLWDSRASCLLEIITDEGVIGWGECFGPARANAALINELFAPLLIGQDPLQRAPLWETLYNRTREFGRKGIAVSALSGIDIALWDIAGKIMGQPIAALLGGAAAVPVTAYASSFYYSGDARYTLEKDAEEALNQGFRAFKMKVGGLGLRQDAQRVARVRQLIGPDAGLAVDANRAYTAREAIQLGRMIEEQDISWFEEPVLPDDFTGYREVRSALHMRIAGGESEFTRFGFRPFLEQRCVDIAQPDVAACGGLGEAWHIAVMATAFGIDCYPHLWGSAISLAATLHLISAIPVAVPSMVKARPLLELDRAPNVFREQLSDLVIGPSMPVPDKPGLGIEIDRSLIRRYAQ